MTAADPLLITVQEAADKLRLSRTSMDKLLNEQSVRSVYIGRYRRVDVASLEKYVKKLLPYPSEASA